MYNDQYNAEILRHTRPTLSELGEYDGTALMEFKTRKEIIYRISRETVCPMKWMTPRHLKSTMRPLDIAFGLGMLYGSSMVA
ncbi:MAG: hypothetical protein IPN18_11615 [Ignavibacteriales bacterium]|nr:hypothetical protein [Ignavibacteriales bacterium]